MSATQTTDLQKLGPEELRLLGASLDAGYADDGDLQGLQRRHDISVQQIDGGVWAAGVGQVASELRSVATGVSSEEAVLRCLVLECKCVVIEVDPRTSSFRASKAHFVDGMRYPLAADALQAPPRPCGLAVGDLVTYKNVNGVQFFDQVVTGFSPAVDDGRFVYFDHEAWWFAESPARLIKQAHKVALHQDVVNSLAGKYGLIPGKVEICSDGVQAVVLERDETDDRYCQAIVRVRDGKMYCHAGLYRDRAIINDGEVEESDLERAMAGAVSRFDRFVAASLEGEVRSSVWYVEVRDSLGTQWLVNPETKLKSKYPEHARSFAEAEARHVCRDLTRLGFRGCVAVNELPATRSSLDGAGISRADEDVTARMARIVPGRILSKDLIASILAEQDEMCSPERICYYESLELLVEKVRSSKIWSQGEVFVWSRSDDEFVVMKQIAPSSCEMLTVTSQGFMDVVTAYRYTQEELVAAVRAHLQGKCEEHDVGPGA